MGVDLIDTADSYGPEVSEGLIFEALHPYPDGLVIATKAGLTRTGSGRSGARWDGPSTCASSASSACAGWASSASTSSSSTGSTPWCRPTSSSGSSPTWWRRAR